MLTRVKVPFDKNLQSVKKKRKFLFRNKVKQKEGSKRVIAVTFAFILILKFILMVISTFVKFKVIIKNIRF